MRFFNTTGPCDESRHYMLPPEQRLPALNRRIAQGEYFVVHAPRQTGKTTAMQALSRRLTAEGTYAALYFSCERARAFPDDVGAAERTLWAAVERAARFALPEALRPGPRLEETAGSFLHLQLSEWAARCPRPLALVFDEIDALTGEPLRAVLSQLRDGFISRSLTPFPHSVILCGVRDVRDYKVASGGDPAHASTGSPFNIKAASLRLADFTEAEVRTLYSQHTAETGQPFAEEALALAWHLTRGQPWLVNALAREVLEGAGLTPGAPITAAHIDAAKDRLILARQTHLDSLVERLHEDRVRKVIGPILAGTTVSGDVLNDDLMYARDLGLVRLEPQLRIANPIYAEVIPRALTHVLQANITQEMAWYEREDGSLDMAALLEAFQEFFAQNSEAWRERFAYQEAGPHLILMAFLQRLINGRGSITREFAIGSGRADLVLQWKGCSYVLELKIRRDTRAIERGVAQLSAYLDRLGEEEGWLVVFDPRTTLTWEEKLYDKQLTGTNNKLIHLFGA